MCGNSKISAENLNLHLPDGGDDRESCLQGPGVHDLLDGELLEDDVRHPDDYYSDLNPGLSDCIDVPVLIF